VITLCDDFDFDWHDMALAGSLAEEMTEEEKERLRLELEMDEGCPCCNDDDPSDP
jgi:hypothetical protein